MVYHVTSDEAQSQLSQLIDAALDGDVVVITNDGGENVQLVPLKKTARRPRFGSGKGLMTMSDDFDAPLSDFDSYMS